MLRRLGREFLDYAINPFVAGVYAGAPEKLGVQQAFPKLHELEQRYGSLIRGQILGARERKRKDVFPNKGLRCFPSVGVGHPPRALSGTSWRFHSAPDAALRISKDSGRWLVDAEQGDSV